jgi:hypothetical protein
VTGSSSLGAAQEVPALPIIQKMSMFQCYLIAKHVKGNTRVKMNNTIYKEVAKLQIIFQTIT